MQRHFADVIETELAGRIERSQRGKRFRRVYPALGRHGLDTRGGVDVGAEIVDLPII